MGAAYSSRAARVSQIKAGDCTNKSSLQRGKQEGEVEAARAQCRGENEGGRADVGSDGGQACRSRSERGGAERTRKRESAVGDAGDLG